MRRKYAELLSSTNTDSFEELEELLNKLEKAEAALEQAKQQETELKDKNKVLEQQNIEKQQENDELDDSIADKKKRLDEENGNAILQVGASIFGKGKLAEAQAENKKLKKAAEQHEAEKKRIQKEADDKVAEEKKRLQQSFTKQVQTEVDKQTKPLSDKIEELETKNATIEVEKLRYKEAYENLQNSSNNHLHRTIEAQNKLLDCVGRLLYQMIDEFKKAVQVVVNFVTDRLPSKYGTLDKRNNMTSDERKVVENCFATLADENNVGSIGALIAMTAKDIGHLNSEDASRAVREVTQIVNNYQPYCQDNSYSRSR